VFIEKFLAYFHVMIASYVVGLALDQLKHRAWV